MLNAQTIRWHLPIPHNPHIGTARRAPALGSHFYPTLFAAAVCHSLDISIVPTLGRIIIELSRPALWTLLAIGDGGLVASDNPGSEPWRLTCSQ